MVAFQFYQRRLGLKNFTIRMAEKGNPVTDPQCEFCPIPQGHHLRHGEQQENPLR